MADERTGGAEIPVVSWMLTSGCCTEPVPPWCRDTMTVDSHSPEVTPGLPEPLPLPPSSPHCAAGEAPCQHKSNTRCNTQR